MKLLSELFSSYAYYDLLQDSSCKLRNVWLNDNSFIGTCAKNSDYELRPQYYYIIFCNKRCLIFLKTSSRTNKKHKIFDAFRGSTLSCVDKNAWETFKNFLRQAF